MRIYLTCFAFFSMLHAGEFLSKSQAQQLLTDVDQLIEAALIDYQIPGLAVGIVVGQELVYAKGFGVRDQEEKLPISVNTLFPIGSCTKAFTTLAFASLIDEGLIDWDDSVANVIKGFRLYDTHATQNMTFRDLCANRTGIPRHDLVWYNSDLSTQQILERLRYLEPVCDLRQRYEYNNLMFLVAGIGMEQASGKKWEEIVSEKILNPLGMKNTHWSLERLQNTSDFASPYLEKNGVLKKIPFRDVSLVNPAGGLYSSLKEMSVWLKFLLNQGRWKGKNLITPSSFAELMTPQIFFTADCQKDENNINGYALGWYVHYHQGYENISHDGGVDGFTSLVSFLPQQKVGVVVLCNKNLSPLPRLLALHLFDLLLELPPGDSIREGAEGIKKHKAALGEEQQKDDSNRKTEAPPTHLLKEYVGVYSHPGYGKIEIDLSKGSLHLNYHQISFDLQPWHYDVFRVVHESHDLHTSFVGKKIGFRSNLDGEIDELLVPFEPKLPSISFRREKKANPFQKFSYLRKFTGTYEIYNYNIEVMIKNDLLTASVVGQPLYELIPDKENEFTVKSYPGYRVCFVLNEKGEVKEVLMKQPYGIVFTAKPKI